MFGWQKKAMATPVVDVHSHLIPAIDDGVRTLDKSIEILKGFSKIGIKKAITTPHIHPNYPNTKDDILSGLEVVNERIQAENIDLELAAAAEYFVDDVFMQRVKEKAEILHFGPNYVLVESSFLNKPIYFEACIFELQSRGYQPVLAHPERYRFLEGELEWLLQLKEMGILFQVTISSFVGFYGTIPQKIAISLYERRLIDFLGSDLHGFNQISVLEEGLRHKMVDKLCRSAELKNKSLL